MRMRTVPPSMPPAHETSPLRRKTVHGGMLDESAHGGMLDAASEKG